jgi:hypothetical protein
MFVAVGRGIITSPDGVTWTVRQSDSSVWAVAYGNGEFVAVGESNSGYIILTSMDGISWTQTQSPFGPLSDVTFGGGQFVALGGSAVLVSSDGTNWIQLQTGFPYVLDFVAFGGGEFVTGAWVTDPATGSLETTILTSADGMNWSQSRMPFAVAGVAYGDGEFVAVTSYPTNAVLTSTDAVDWKASATALDLDHIAYCGSEFVAVGNRGAIATSTDGVNWVEHQSSAPRSELNAVAYGNGQFLAVGGVGSILTSTDGTTWIRREANMYGPLKGVTYGGGQFVAGGFGLGYATGAWKSGFFVSSADGMNWSEPSAPYSEFGTVDTDVSSIHVCFGNGTFAATADYFDMSFAVYSTNGMTWMYGEETWGHPCLCGPPPYLYPGGVTYGDGLFVAVREESSAPPQSAVLTSADGRGWVTHELGSQDGLVGVAFGIGRFVALGSFGTNLISADGMNWTRVLSGTDASLNAIAYGGHQFVAVGDAVLTSPDGISWSQRDSTKDFPLQDVAYRAGQFVAVGNSGSILTSADGISWQRRSSGTNRNLWGVAYGGGHFVAVGDYGTILESDSILILAVTSSATNGLVTISLTGPANLACAIQSSPDLSSWRNLTNIITTQEGASVFDAPPSVSNVQFYRAYSQ